MEQSFDTIKIIPFLTAIDKQDPSILDVDQEKFDEYVIDYMELVKDKPNNFEKRLEVLKRDTLLISSCLYYLSKEIADPEIMAILNENGHKIEKDTYFQDIEKIHKDLKVLLFRRENLEKKMPKKLKPKKIKERGSIFTILTGLSTGLEMSLDFQAMCVSEFISWRGNLDAKIKSMQKSNKKSNGK
jgi:hypothetical protein